MSEATQLAVRPKASQQLAQLIGMQPEAMLDTIKAQCFKTTPDKVTDAQLAAFVSIAADMGVNPLLPGMLYAYPIQGGGIIPIMGPDGIYKKLSERDDIDSWEIEVFPADVALPPTHAIAKIWRKGREKPLTYTALFSEWKINSNPNWNTRPRHMLSLRALKHCARQIIHGIPGDEDDRHIMGEINVTPGAEEQTTKRADPPARKSKGANAVEAKTEQKPIDVEVLPPKQEEQKKETPPPETKQEAPPARPEPKPVVEEKTTPAAAPVARDSLKEEERVTVTCVIEKVYALMVAVAGTPTPSVQATVKGEFNGSVFHFGAASKDGKGDLAPSPEWKVGSTVKIDLFGRVNKNTGKVMAKVEKIVPMEESADTPIDVG